MNAPTNASRARVAREAIAHHSSFVGNQTEDLETQLSDFMANLMHLCAAEKIDISECMTRGCGHYIEEVRDGV